MARKQDFDILIDFYKPIPAMPELGGQGRHWPPIFDRSGNPIPTGGGQIMPTNYFWQPKI